MAKEEKKKIRAVCRTAAFERDNHKCAVCKCGPSANPFDAHHITPRSEMPGGGYVVENLITLCWTCHIKAETFKKDPLPGYGPEELYAIIGSSKDLAVRKSNERLEKHGSSKI